MDSPQPDPAGAPSTPPQSATAMAAATSARTFAMLCHLTAFAGIIVPPVGHLLGPFIVWMIKKDQMPEVDAHGKESLNFQLSWTIYAAVSFPLVLLLAFFLVGFLVWAAMGAFWIAFVVIASVKANDGVLYRYPLTIRFLR